jgi:hypothetical protein
MSQNFTIHLTGLLLMLAASQSQSFSLTDFQAIQVLIALTAWKIFQTKMSLNVVVFQDCLDYELDNDVIACLLDIRVL